MPPKIQYYTPKSRKISFNKIESQELQSTMTVVQERTRKYASKNVPIMAKIHPKALHEIAALGTKLRSPSLVQITLYLIQQLKDETGEIEVLLKDIEKELQLAENTVRKAVNVLKEDLELITETGRGRYIISPRLAFFGEPFDWSIALEKEKEGKEAIVAEINKMRTEIEKMEDMHLQAFINEQNNAREHKTL